MAIRKWPRVWISSFFPTGMDAGGCDCEPLDDTTSTSGDNNGWRQQARLERKVWPRRGCRAYTPEPVATAHQHREERHECRPNRTRRCLVSKMVTETNSFQSHRHLGRCGEGGCSYRVNSHEKFHQAYIFGTMNDLRILHSPSHHAVLMVSCRLI